MKKNLVLFFLCAIIIVVGLGSFWLRLLGPGPGC